MTVSQGTTDKITKAFADLDAAGSADAVDATATAARDAAVQAELVAKNASIVAHQTALDSAHAAINALQAELLGAPAVPTPAVPS